ncbi:MAG TPA: hypothetical protein VJN50_06340 [Actinomycetota bacterium]|nr:hypothetical protein [Actinomycetota bacterium]
MTLVDECAPAGIVGTTSPSHSASRPLRAVLLALPFVALAELLLMRTFYRVGIFIPKEGSFETVYAALSDVGSFAFDLASVLALAAFGMLALVALRRGDLRLGLAMATFVISIPAALAAGVEAVGPVPRLAFLLAVLGVVLPFLRSRADVAHRIFVGAVASCFVLSTYTGIAQGPGVNGAPAVAGGQIAAELLVVLAAAIAAMAWIRTEGFRLGPPVVAAPLAASFLAAWMANGSVTGILVLWTVGLRLYLAPWVYAIALWAFLAAAIGWLRHWPWRSAGLVLLVVAGVFVSSTYQQSLGVLAVVLLTDGVAFGGLPALGERWSRRERWWAAGRRGPAASATKRAPTSASR